jgi:hypothetical protein
MKARSNFIWILAIVLLLTGIMMVTNQALVSRDRFAKIQIKSTLLSELENYAEAARMTEQAREKLIAENAAQPVLLAPMVTRDLSPTATIHPNPPRDIGNGWNLQSSAIEFNAVPWPQIQEFIRTLEIQRPPWKPTAITFTTGPNGTGSGSITVQTPQAP